MREQYWKPDKSYFEQAASWRSSRPASVVRNKFYVSSEQTISSSKAVSVTIPKPLEITRKYRRNRKLEFALFFLMAAGSLYRPTPNIKQAYSPSTSEYFDSFSRQGALYLSETDDPESAQEATEYVVKLQNPDGSIRNSLYEDKVVPMDVALWAITASKIKDSRDGEDGYYLHQAKKATNWLLLHLSPVDGASPDSLHSFYGEYHVNGKHFQHSRWGRGEAVGISLEAIRTVVQQDPNYLYEKVIDENGKEITVLDGIEKMVTYLTSPQMQSPDGRINHAPYFQQRYFGEEQGRDYTGLLAAAELYAQAAINEKDDEKRKKYFSQAAYAQRAAEKLFSGVKENGFDTAQTHDPIGFATWGVSDPEIPNTNEAKKVLAENQIAGIDATDFVTEAGLRGWDMQEITNSNGWERLKYWIKGKFIFSSQTLDFAQANIQKGDITRARNIVDQVKERQNYDGSIPVAYGPSNTFMLNIGGAGYPTMRYLDAEISLGHINKKIPPPKELSLLDRFKNRFQHVAKIFEDNT